MSFKGYLNNAGTDVWSCSSGGNSYAWGVGSSSGTLSYYSYVTNSLRVAPAFNLNLEKVLIARNLSEVLTQAAPATYTAPSADVAFTMLVDDKASSFATSIHNMKVTAGVGGTYTINYSGASTSTLNGGTNYISAILYDSNDTIQYYWHLGTVTDESGSVEITMPSQIGTYKLAVFEEEVMSDTKATNYASTPSLTTVEVANTVTVTFDSNGGTTVSNEIYTANGTYGTLPIPTKIGYSFVGWYKESSLINQVTTTSTVSSSNHTLYAKWQANTDTKFTVNYYYEQLDGTYDFIKSQTFEGTTDESVETIDIHPDMIGFTYSKLIQQN